MQNLTPFPQSRVYFVLWLTDSAICFAFLPKNFVEWSGFPLKNLLPALKKFVKNNFVLAFFGILPQSLNYYVVTLSSPVHHFV